MVFIKSIAICILSLAFASRCGNVIVGDGNRVTGDNNILRNSHGNRIEGSNNYLQESLRNQIMGDWNRLYATQGINIQGHDHLFYKGNEEPANNLQTQQK